MNRITKFKPLTSVFKLLTPSSGFSFSRKNQKGFTLVEILVVFTIITILSGIGFASFVEYSRSQKLSQTANNMKLMISQARFSALSVVKSNTDLQGATYTCSNNALEGYAVTVSGTQLELAQRCVGLSARTIKLIILPAEVSFSTAQPGGNQICTTVNFASLSATANGTPCDIVLTDSSGKMKILRIDSAGNASIQ